MFTLCDGRLRARRAKVPRLEMDPCLLLAQVLVLYALVSGLEWCIHCRVMHGSPEALARVPLVGALLASYASEHVAHHTTVGADMLLVAPPEDSHLTFGWPAMLGCALTLGLLMLATGLYSPCTVAWVAPLSALLFMYVWNCWHVRFHGEQQCVPPRRGPPNRPELPAAGPLYRALWKYHAVHHTQKGMKYNFNIVCPGFDWLMGTMGSRCYDNHEYCRTTASETAACRGRLAHCYSDGDVLAVGPAIAQRVGARAHQLHHHHGDDDDQEPVLPHLGEVIAGAARLAWRALRLAEDAPLLPHEDVRQG